MSDFKNHINSSLPPGSLAQSSAMHHAVPLSTRYLAQPMSSATTFSPLPPIPSRTIPTRNPYSRMASSYYNPYSRYPTNMFSSGFGGYRMSPYGGNYYGAGPAEGAPYNSFLQMAEESTRPAFESIESVVEVVSSISMMLESTYGAVHSSYSAILGVVDQFSRLKDHLAQILSIFALLRGLRWLCLKVLYILRLRKDNPSEEAAWSSAERLSGSPFLPSHVDRAKGSAWPFLVFVGLVVGAPWLMFKLLSKSVAAKIPVDMRIFQDESGMVLKAYAAYDFTATRQDELSFSAGEELLLAPSSLNSGQAWIYACNTKNQTGLIPRNYLVSRKKHQPALVARQEAPRPPLDSVDLVTEFTAPSNGQVKPEKAKGNQ